MPVTRKRPRHAAEAGQALIETALVLPLILILLFLVVDFGIALDRRESILHSLREAGRSAAAGASYDTIVNRAVAESDGVVAAGEVSVCYKVVNINGVAEEVGRISINHEYTLTVGSGEMLTAFGLTAPTIDISPTAEVLLTNGAPGVAPC
jgi:hypothetical protein